MGFSNDWTYWLIWLGVLALNALFVYVAWWGLFGDRARGRRRCPRCWYDMAYSPGMTCAECGFTAGRETQFSRTRRRYGVALGAIFASVAMTLAANHHLAQRGVLSALPTQVLLWMLPISNTPQSHVFAEILTRGNRGQLSDSQWRRLVERAAAGDWFAKPVSDAWVRKYGDFIINSRRSFVGADELEQSLLSIPPRIDVKARPTWPQSTPVTLGVQVRDWWPADTECRIRAAPRLDGFQTIVFHRGAIDRFMRTPYSLHLPPLDASTESVTIDFQVQRRLRTSTAGSGAGEGTSPEAVDGWEIVANKSIVVPVRIDDVLAKQTSPLQDPEADQLVMQAFANGAVKWASGASPVRFSVNPQPTFAPPFDGAAVGVRVELMRGEELARRLNLWWLGGVSPTPAAAGFGLGGRNYGFEVDYENQSLLQFANTTDGLWRIRVVGDPVLALRAGAATKHWAGEFTMPLSLQLRRDAAPPRPWWTESQQEVD